MVRLPFVALFENRSRTHVVDRIFTSANCQSNISPVCLAVYNDDRGVVDCFEIHFPDRKLLALETFLNLLSILKSTTALQSSCHFMTVNPPGFNPQHSLLGSTTKVENYSIPDLKLVVHDVATQSDFNSTFFIPWFSIRSI